MIILIFVVLLGRHMHLESNPIIDQMEFADQSSDEEELLKKSLEDEFLNFIDISCSLPIQVCKVLFSNQKMKLPSTIHFRHYPPPNFAAYPQTV
ncbi:hypothetical protein [Sphingobacterium endophyticum]|uniref:hypothetical protein n=1 Tax=Sphingobacterium endophyticum TaxID=2546448 RepID=UPI0012E2A7D1|nr:hypothetical protein [Sphingobacterium endophyticum]